MALLQSSGVGRDINRHHYGREEVEAALRKRVVGTLIQPIRLRNEPPAFGGAFSLLQCAHHQLHLRWQSAAHWSELRVDLADMKRSIRVSDGAGGAREIFLLA